MIRRPPSDAEPASRRRLRSQWAIVAVIAGLVVVFSTAAVFFARIMKFEQAASLEQNEAIARGVASSIHARQEGQIGVLRAYAGRFKFREAIERKERDAAGVHLQQLRAGYPDLDRVFLADAAGVVWASDPPSPEIYGKNYAFRDWYRGVSREWRPYMSEVYETDLGHALAIAQTVPVRGEDGRVIGILASVQRLETLRAWLLPTTVPGGDLFVVDRRGRLIFHPTRSGAAQISDYAAIPVVQRVIRGVDGISELDNPVDGGANLYAYRWLPSLGWGVIVQRPKDVALQRTRLLVLVAGVAGLCLTAALAVLGIVAMRRERQLGAVLAERERAEAALRQSHAFLDSVIENLPNMVFVKDARELRFVRFNKAAEDLLGHSRHDLIGKNDYDFFPRADADFFTAKDREVLAGGAVLDIAEEPMQTRGGERRLLRTKKVPIYDEAGVPQYLLGISEDITARKEADDRLREAQREAERANQAKSEFLSRMSHELRTPLNSIIGFGQLLELDASSPAQRESVEHILKGGRHLLALINEVLDIARIEAGNLSMSLEPVVAGEVCRMALDLVRPQAAQRNVQLVNRVGESLWVTADRQRLQQVFLNLLSNAVKYNVEGGHITVSSQRTAEGRIELSVADTGPGIAPEVIGRLFTPFDRLGAEQSGVEGTGLGLALSKRLVEAMGGRIGVDSAPGQGTRFTVELHAADDPSRAQLGIADDTAHRARRPEAGGTVLYIEDNLSNLRLLERVVARRPDITLLSAMQGRRGLELAHDHRPDVVILDLHLPDMSGREVLAALRGDHITREIPVVVLSADATPHQIERLLGDGAHSYLTKPLDVHLLLTTLDDLLGKRER